MYKNTPSYLELCSKEYVLTCTYTGMSFLSFVSRCWPDNSHDAMSCLTCSEMYIKNENIICNFANQMCCQALFALKCIYNKKERI